MGFKHHLIAACAITITTCPLHAKSVQFTPMQLQAMQSKEFKTTKDQVFSCIVTVFQDEGYQIVSADMASGFVTAESANKGKTNLFEAFAGMAASGHTRATAFMEQMPSGMTRLRLNFLNTKNSSTNRGQSNSRDKPVLNPESYQAVFNRVEEALFERGALTKTATAQPPTVQIPVTATTSISETVASKPAPKP